MGEKREVEKDLELLTIKINKKVISLKNMDRELVTLKILLESRHNNYAPKSYKNNKRMTIYAQEKHTGTDITDTSKNTTRYNSKRRIKRVAKERTTQIRMKKQCLKKTATDIDSRTTRATMTTVKKI